MVYVIWYFIIGAIMTFMVWMAVGLGTWSSLIEEYGKLKGISTAVITLVVMVVIWPVELVWLIKDLIQIHNLRK